MPPSISTHTTVSETDSLDLNLKSSTFPPLDATMLQNRPLRNNRRSQSPMVRPERDVVNQLLTKARSATLSDPLRYVLQTSDVVGTFKYRFPVLGLKRPIVNIRDVKKEDLLPFKNEETQFEVVRPSHVAQKGALGLLVSTGALAEAIRKQDKRDVPLNRTTRHSPISDRDPWVILNAPAGHCFVPGQSCIQQYRPAHRLEVYREVIHKQPVSFSDMPDLKVDGHVLLDPKCGDIVEICPDPTDGQGNYAEKYPAAFFITPAVDNGLTGYRRRKYKIPPTYTLGACYRSEQSSIGAYRTLCIAPGVPARWTNLSVEPADRGPFTSRTNVRSLQLPVSYEWSCM
ncbi:hypothetical protein P389DRAFT_200099 [Cystobasidium minutum MCA 4210]|uniref:uncharacterized protein n=1 Tax=Cystobasidium minutum MCA 4210 TaxID=1397322 RepID=UPI0034CE86D0|eukprot:jgi/Rhomi1/200099/MIX928_7_100